MQLLRIHYQKLFLCMSFFMLIIVVFRIWDRDGNTITPQQPLKAGLKGPERATSPHENGINIDAPALSAVRHRKNRHKNEKMQSALFVDLFLDLAKEETCPLCFGNYLCEDISAGFLTLDSDTPVVKEGEMVYEAHLGDLHKLSVKVPSGERFSLLDEMVCLNASLEVGCSSGSASVRSYLAKQPLSSRTLYHLLRTVGVPRTHYPLLMCPSKKLLTVIEQSFDEDNDHKVSADERIALYTSLAVAPDIVVLKILTKANLNVGFPRLAGVCGRIAVLEGELTPLSSLLDEPFSVRASLAAQILTMVDDFMEDDPEWYLFYAPWTIDRLAVNKEGEVVLTDLSSMAIVDKALFRDEYDEGTEGRNEEICNQECFQKFTAEVYREDNSLDEVCARVEDVGHLMYAAVCAMILSDMKQHKYVDYFTGSGIQRQEPRVTNGLLHDIPAADRATVEELLAECVDEAAPGGRFQAAQELREFLSDFLNENDDGDISDDQGDDGEDEDYDDDDYDYEDDTGKKKG
ncbi:divergent protein kinase domain 2A-like [Palaemon carinicauda]|uniref:divergent protein kinase domain 2A-like n=1 Tax=Palaemon carinicauda TaxID=392227 RepID=UPI0035B5DF4F